MRRALVLAVLLLAGRAHAQIVTVSATYGSNLVPPPTGNATAQITTTCNGQMSCSYAVWYYNFTPDPGPGKTKLFSATWTCSGVVHQTNSTPLYNGNEAGYGSIATLSCAPPTPTPTPTPTPVPGGGIVLLPGTGNRVKISTICAPPSPNCLRDPWHTDQYLINESPGVKIVIQVSAP